MHSYVYKVKTKFVSGQGCKTKMLVIEFFSLGKSLFPRNYLDEFYIQASREYITLGIII